MASEAEKQAADAALERALRRVARVHGLIPPNATVVDWLQAYHGICAEIMTGAFEAAKEALNGEAQAPGRQP